MMKKKLANDNTSICAINELNSMFKLRSSLREMIERSNGNQLKHQKLVYILEEEIEVKRDALLKMYEG